MNDCEGLPTDELKPKRNNCRRSIRITETINTPIKNEEPLSFDKHDEDLLNLIFKGINSSHNVDNSDEEEVIHPDKCERQKKFRSQKSHLKIITDLNTLKCNVCKMEFADINDLKCHLLEELRTSKLKISKNTSVVELKNIDPKIKNLFKDLFICEICSRRFMFQKQLEAHKNEHANKRLFTCGVCQKNFMSKELFDSHCEIHSTKISCGTCQAIFKSREALRRHTRAVHLHKAPRRYLCKMCGLVVTDILSHATLHDMRVTFCHLCDCHFTNIVDYDKHLRQCEVLNERKSVDKIYVDVACGANEAGVCVHNDKDVVRINAIIYSKGCETTDLKYESDEDNKLSAKRMRVE